MGQSSSQNKKSNASKSTEHKQTCQQHYSQHTTYDMQVLSNKQFQVNAILAKTNTNSSNIPGSAQQPQQKQGLGNMAPSPYPSPLAQQGQKINWQHMEKNMDVAAARPRRYKVWCRNRRTRKIVKASNLKELREQGALELGFLWSQLTVVLECDGTEVKDEAHFQTFFEDTIFLLLRPGEKWFSPVLQTRQSFHQSSNYSSFSGYTSQQSVYSGASATTTTQCGTLLSTPVSSSKLTNSLRHRVKNLSLLESQHSNSQQTYDVSSTTSTSSVLTAGNLVPKSTTTNQSAQNLPNRNFLLGLATLTSALKSLPSATGKAVPNIRQNMPAAMLGYQYIMNQPSLPFCVAETTVSPPMPITTLSPEPEPITFKEGPSSPIPNLDTEILKTNLPPITVPDEMLPPFQLIDVFSAEPLKSSLSSSAEIEGKEKNVEGAKYRYKKDQWSPLNPEGKKQYDRDFLLHLQTQPMSMRKPSNLRQLSVIKDKPNIHRLTIYEAPNTELLGKVKGILNKLTLQNFSILMEQFMNLKFNTEAQLASVIDLVFKMAIDQPNYSFLYAKMCKELSKISVPLAGQAGQSVNFEKLLLLRCQVEFDQYGWSTFKREERIKAIESAENEEERKILQFVFDKENEEIKYGRLGNIWFMVELFQLDIAKSFMRGCIKELLLQRDEDSLECLCRLLKTTGKELDEIKTKCYIKLIKFCFNDMQEIVDKCLASLKIRVMLQDVIDLKKNNWVPKMTDQIHKKVETGVQGQQIDLQNVQCNIESQDREKDSAGEKVFENERTPTKDNYKSYSTVDPQKLRLITPAKVGNMHSEISGSGPSSSAKSSNEGYNYVQTRVYTNSLVASSQSNQMPQHESELPSITKETLLMKQKRIEQQTLRTRQQTHGKRQKIVAKKQKNAAMKQKTSKVQTTPSEAHVNVKDNSVVALKGIVTGEETKKRSNDITKPLTDECKLKEDTEKLKATNSKNRIQSKPKTNLREIKKNLDFLLKNSNENEQVLTWFKDNVPGDQLSEPSFIRALVEVVHKNAITGLGVHCKLDAYILRKRGTLLRHYIDYNENLELQALYALQALFNQLHKPEKILPRIFKILYENDVIDEEAFSQWKNSTDPKEQEGKNVALRSAGYFLTYMNDGSNEETDED